MAVLDSDTEQMVNGSLSVADAVDVFRSLGSVVSAVEVGSCSPDDLVVLTAGVRAGQQALDRMVTQIASTADAHAVDGRGRGAQGVLLGDGHAVRGRTAHRETDRARTSTALSKVAAAVAAGRVGGAQVDAITFSAKGLAPDQFESLNTDGLVEAAVSMPADVFARHVRQMVENIKGDAGLADAKKRRARTSWKHWFDERTGMGHVHGEFDPERYESIVGSVEAELTRLSNQGGVSKNAQLAADAAYNLLTGSAARGGSGRPHISVVVDWETFSNGSHESSVRETADGHPLARESIARLACDAVVQRIVLDPDGVPINVGRQYRTATDAQWKALRAIDRSCVWAGCDRPLAWCQLHHVQEWEHGGATDLCNLIPLVTATTMPSMKAAGRSKSVQTTDESTSSVPTERITPRRGRIGSNHQKPEGRQKLLRDRSRWVSVPVEPLTLNGADRPTGMGNCYLATK